MMPERRKYEMFEDDRKKWEIHFDLENDRKMRGNSTISLNLILKDNDKRFLSNEDIENLKQDLKDLGKLRIIKEGKGFLGE